MFSHIVRILSNPVLGFKDNRGGVRNCGCIKAWMYSGASLDGRRTSVIGGSQHAFCRQVTM